MSVVKPHQMILTPVERKLLADAVEMFTFEVAAALKTLHDRHPEAEQCGRFREALATAHRLSARLAT